MNIHQWAIKWGVSIAALEDLTREFRTTDTGPTVAALTNVAPGSEAMVSSLVRLEATRRGKRLFRNNVGAGFLSDGSFIRWGLANDSASMNKKVKSADLVGISGEIITPADVGQPRGRFVAREVKAPDWRYSGTERELAQLRFLELIAAYGGDACFTIGEGTL